MLLKDFFSPGEMRLGTGNVGEIVFSGFQVLVHLFGVDLGRCLYDQIVGGCLCF